MKLNRRAILAPVAIIGAGLLFWLFLEHGLGQRRVTRYKQQLRMAGERLNIEDHLPFPLPPEQNSAGVIRPYFSLLSSNDLLLERYSLVSMRMIAPGRASVAWAETHPAGLETNTWAGAEAAVDRYAEMFQSLWQIIERPRLDFGLDYRQGPALMLPHIHPLRVAGTRLSTAVVCDLHRGEIPGAIINLRAMLALARAMTEEQLVISQVQRGYMTRLCLGATWELLECTNLTEAQFATLQRDWQGLEFIHAAEKALEMDRAMNLFTIERMRRSNTEFTRITGIGGQGRRAGPLGADQILGDAASRTGARAQQNRWRWYWSYTDEFRLLEGMQAILEGMRLAGSGQPFTLALRHQADGLAALGLHNNEDPRGNDDSDLRTMFSQSLLWLRTFPQRVAVAESARQLAITAIALHRYRLQHGNWPADVRALVPEFCADVPRDPMDGQPLRYRLQPDGQFRLYCIGPDGIDDHGDGSSTNKTKTVVWQEGRDLVWPEAVREPNSH